MKNEKNSNSKILVINSAASVGIKVGSILIALLTTPAYIRYFDNSEILGAWFTILSVLAWILNCDMGIGNGLRDRLVYAISQNDRERIRKSVSSAYIFLFGVAGVVTAVVVVLCNFVSWNRIFNISEDIIPTAVFNKAVLILIASILLQLVLRLVTSILYALQKAFIPGLLSLITNVIMLALVTICNSAGRNNDIVQLAVFYLLAVNLPLVAATFVVFCRDLRDSIPTFRSFSMDSALSVLSTGSKFLWLQLMALVLDNTNSYLISAFVGNAAVVEYQIYYKIFSLPGTVVLLLSATIWSIITKAKAEKNYVWLRKSYYLFMIFCMAAAAFEFALIPVLQIIFNLWLGADTIPVNATYALIFAISGSVMMFRTFLCTYSNGMCKLKNQMIWLTVGAVVNIPLAYALSRITNDMASVMIANAVCMLPYCVVEVIHFCVGFRKGNCERFID